MVRKVGLLLTAVLAACALAVGPTTGHADAPGVAVVALHGVLVGGDADALDAAIANAVAASQPCVVIDIDSLGGSPGVISRIATSEAGSAVPVIAFVGAGAHADAGALVVAESAAVIGAAPTAEFGASHPLDLHAVLIPGVATGDASAALAQVATLHARQTAWLRTVAEHGGSVTGSDAVHRGAADIVVSSDVLLLQALDGKHLGSTTLVTNGVTLTAVAPEGWNAVVKTLAQPDSAFALLIIAVLCLSIFIASPAAFVLALVALFTGIGAVIGFLNLPTNLLGLALVGVSLLLFAIDVKAVTHGGLGAAGAVAMALGGWRLVDTGTLDNGVSTALVVITVAAIAGAYAVLVPKLIAARSLPFKDAEAELVGRVGTVREALEPHGYVAVDGVLWRATATLSPQPVGATVRVVELSGLRLTVEPDADPPAADPD